MLVFSQTVRQGGRTEGPVVKKKKKEKKRRREIRRGQRAQVIFTKSKAEGRKEKGKLRERFLAITQGTQM